MKRATMLVLIAALAVAANAGDFFGIPILSEPKDDINAIIQNLIKGEYEKANLHLKHLGETAPKLGRTIKLSDFTIPCADCLVEKNPKCEICEGRLKAVDPHALRYLQYKFDRAIEEHEPVGQAWASSIKAFNVRKKQVPAREVFQGQILKIGQDAFLIKSVDGEVFNLMGCVTTGAQVGQPYVGYCWPMPKHPFSYKDEKGKSRTVKSYTLNLWWDY
jgi:hypothetical protein